MFKKVLLGIMLMISCTTGFAGQYSVDFKSLDNTYELKATITTQDVANAVGGHNITSIAGKLYRLGTPTDIQTLIDNPGQPYAVVNYGFVYDNNQFDINSFFNTNGVLFKLTNGSVWNLWANNSVDYELYSYIGVDKRGTFQDSKIPEPDSLLLVTLGLLIATSAISINKPR